MHNIAEAYYFRWFWEDSDKKLINKELIKFIEERMNDLSNLIMIGFDYKQKRRKENRNDLDTELYKKFRGNSIQKRKTGNQEKYSKVAKLIKVAEEHFPQLKLTQTTACEIAHCNNYSFTRWKNYSKNYDLFLEWQKKMGAEEVIEIKIEIMNYFKLHSDM